MAVKTYNDGGRFLLVIEPVGDEELKLIKEIKKICGLENEETKNLEGIVPPSIPTTKAPETTLKVGEGYKAYLDTMIKLKKKELTGDARKDAIDAVKKTAEVLKTKIPKGDNLKFCVENMSDMFSERIENAVLTEMGISKKQLIMSDEEVMTKAYKLAVTL